MFHTKSKITSLTEKRFAYVDIGHFYSCFRILHSIQENALCNLKMLVNCFYKIMLYNINSYKYNYEILNVFIKITF
jgi:hypothetical protein